MASLSRHITRKRPLDQGKDLKLFSSFKDLYRHSGGEDEVYSAQGVGKTSDQRGFGNWCAELSDSQLEDRTEYQQFLATERHDQQDRILTLFQKKRRGIQLP